MPVPLILVLESVALSIMVEKYTPMTPKRRIIGSISNLVSNYAIRYLWRSVYRIFYAGREQSASDVHV